MASLKQNIKDDNHQLTECLEVITQAGDNYEKIVRHQFSLYDTSTCKEFFDHMKNKRDNWEEGKVFSAQELRELSLNKFNTIT